MKEQLEKRYRSLSLLEGGGRAHYNLPKKSREIIKNLSHVVLNQDACPKHGKLQKQNGSFTIEQQKKNYLMKNNYTLPESKQY